MTGTLPPLPLPEGVDAQYIQTDTGLTHHVLRAGDPDRPVLMLLHGFPEIAFSWRHVMPRLAEAGFHVVAPDQRGYGRTTGWTDGYDVDLGEFSILNRVRDAVALVRALGHTSIHGLIGHDYGAHVTAWAAQVRGDVFRRAVCMSAPFGGPPSITLRTDPTHADLLDLARPRKHYQWYYATRPAAADMEQAPQGLHAFLRAYFHMKSADWPENRPFALKRWDAENLAQMPTYYIMDADQDMAATVAPHMPSAAEIASCDWLSERDLAVYTAEFGRTGLQGALNSYRCGTDPAFRRDLSVFHGQKIQIPMTFIAGQQDWGWAQVPGALEAMETRACADYRGTHLIESAGHWVQQEQPELVADLVIQAMRDLGTD